MTVTAQTNENAALTFNRSGAKVGWSDVLLALRQIEPDLESAIPQPCGDSTKSRSVLPSALSHIPSGLKHRKISATVGGSSENTCNHAGTDRTDLTPQYVRANTAQWTSGEIGPLAKVGRRSSVKAWLSAEQFTDLSTGGCPYLSKDNCAQNKMRRAA